MTHTTLIGPRELASIRATAGGAGSPAVDQRLVIVDCRFDLADTGAGARAYEQAHISGAVYAHLDRDLSGAKTGANGRHPLPTIEALVTTLGRLGIGPGVQVVAYDLDTGMYASRLWWLLRWMGHDAVAVLDGGFAKWTEAGLPTSSGIENRAARTFTGAPREQMTVTAMEVAALASSPDWHLVDARAPERYRGDVEPLDPVAGHIPGAVNHFYQRNLDEGTFRRPEDLRAEFRGVVGDTSGDHVVCYCGSGVTACHNLLALEHAGLSGARLYPGSWSEWVSDPNRPVERG
jgi:thiosulfate/3-mercaptopyruvate sulfurtransferase